MARRRPDAIPAVVLAGGRATRLGGADKCLLTWRGRPILAAILEGLRPQAGPIALNANGDPARFSAWGLAVLPDPVAGQPGPLAGVLAAMRWASALGCSRVITWPCDSPVVPPDLVAGLAASGLAYAATTRPHPVAALWPVAAAPSLTAALERGERRVLAFAQAAGLVACAWPGEPFVNVNAPEDLG